MQVVEHEIKRYDSLSEEVEKKKKRGMRNNMSQVCYGDVTTVVKMDPDNGEIKKDAERSRKKLLTLVKKQEILLRGKSQGQIQDFVKGGLNIEVDL